MGKRGNRTKFQCGQKAGKWVPIGNKSKRKVCPGEQVFSELWPSSTG